MAIGSHLTVNPGNPKLEYRTELQGQSMLPPGRVVVRGCGADLEMRRAISQYRRFDCSTETGESCPVRKIRPS